MSDSINMQTIAAKERIMFNFKKKSLTAKGEKQPALRLRTLNDDEVQTVSGGKTQGSPNVALQCCNGKHIPTAIITAR